MQNFSGIANDACQKLNKELRNSKPRILHRISFQNAEFPLAMMCSVTLNESPCLEGQSSYIQFIAKDTGEVIGSFLLSSTSTMLYLYKS